MWFLTTIACGWLDTDPAFLDTPTDPVRPTPAAAATSVALTWLDPATVQVPPSSRPAAAPPRIGLQGSFTLHDERERVQIWSIPLPIHEGLLPNKEAGTHVIGNHAPPGLEVSGPAGDLPFHRRATRPGSWGFDRHHLYVGLPPGAPPPDPAAYSLVFPRATAYEDRLNLATSGLDPASFVIRTAVVGQTSHRGLLLPAPATVTFDVVVPAEGVLTFDASMLPPAIHEGLVSDGAEVRISVRSGDDQTEVGRVSVGPDGSTPVRIDLSAFASRAVTLQLATDPGPSPTLDYVFLTSPVIFTPDADPDRVILLFVDTLRPDHLGLYGYERDTSPNLDRWGAHAAVFADAVSVAPWTLPSARAVLTGLQPEQYFDAVPLQQHLGARGFRTEAVVANAFLSHPFDLYLGWDRYDYGHLIDATDVVSRARRILATHGDRDLLLMVHFMEPHLPYGEPNRFLDLFAGTPPKDMPGLSRFELSKVPADAPNLDAIRRYVIDRYDQNIRAVDAALLDLLHDAGSDATVVLFSDHGEEFWDHGGFEHGHSFHEELLHTVLAIRGPKIPAGRHDAPVSLIDVTPTLLDALGLPVDGLTGRSLVPLAWGDAGSIEALADRPRGFGRPLYGDDGWGVIHRDHKWWARSGEQRLYDRSADPTEGTDLAATADLAPYPGALARALDRPVTLVWRVTLRSMKWPEDVTVTLSHPDGIAAAWLGYEPRGRSRRPPERVGGRVQLEVPGGDDPPPILYLKPAGDPHLPDGLAITFVGRGLKSGAVVEDRGRIEATAERNVLLYAGDPRFSAAIDVAWVPDDAGTAVAGFHPDVEAQLRDLGYVDPEE